MVMHVAKWQLVVRVENSTLPGGNTSPAQRQVHRQQLDAQIARDRDNAYRQWMLMGGTSNR